MKYHLVTILGHTAGGKTALATAVADRLGGEVISADSRQVYRHMDLGTGKEQKITITASSGLSEDEIEQIIEKVVTNVVEKLAGTILERVAWEVVPDLAEHLIREEIRKIKDAAA